MSQGQLLHVDSLPTWIHNITLNKAANDSIGENFDRITDITLDNVTKELNHYCLLLRVSVKVNLKDNSQKTISFLLKTQNARNDVIPSLYSKLGLLSKEELMYQKILPGFEQLYREVGKSVKFTPRAFTFDADIGHDYVLLEDLSARKYQQDNRNVGLDMPHIEEALQKLAELHAASACYVEHFGMYGDQFTKSPFEGVLKIKEFSSSKEFLSQVQKIKCGDKLYEKLLTNDEQLADRLLELEKVNAREFNVLNHGDLWVNNIFFQHDAFGVIKDTLFIDFQAVKYGSPARDLLHFILLSAQPSIKLTRFEYMVKFYYDHLIENLTLLNYHRPLPKLRNIHTSILNHGLSAYLVLSKVMPMVMFNDSSDCVEPKTKTITMYNNPRFVQALEEILPWLDNRGGLDWA